MRAQAIVLIIASNILGGVSYLWQRQALDGMDAPISISLGRSLVGLACLAGWLVSRGGIRWRYPLRDWARLGLVGTLAFAAPMVMGIVGVQWSTASNGSILILLEPAAILVLARILLAETIRPAQAWGVAAGLAGALCLVLQDAPLSGLAQSRHTAGNLMLAGHALLWGLYSPLMRPLARKYSAADITFVTTLIATAVLVPASLFERHEWTTAPALGSALLYVLLLGVLVSFAATLFWNRALKHLSASTVAPFIFVQPLTGVLAARLVRGETLTPAALFGGLLIATGVLAVIRPAPKPRPADA